MSKPKRSRNALNTSVLSGAAPDIANLTLEKSYWSTPGRLVHATYIGGAPHKTVIFPSSMSLNVGTGSKRSSSTPDAPFLTIKPRGTFRPNM
jgi:hypothetical protein